MSATAAKQVFQWKELPAIDLLGGTMRRTGFRSDGCILTFNWIQPTMPRWEPHHHPFDQVVLTVKGRQMLEVEGEAMDCTAGTITRVPANAKHTGWPVGAEPILNIDVFAPPREDYLFLVEYQKEYPQPKGPVHKYHQTPTAQPFAGKVKTDTKDILFAWDKLRMTRAEPHSHPFDQIVMVASGRMMLEIDGQAMECGPESIVRVPASAPHTGWALGDEPILNIDVFAPARKDYLDLVKYQKDCSQ